MCFFLFSALFRDDAPGGATPENLPRANQKHRPHPPYPAAGLGRQQPSHEGMAPYLRRQTALTALEKDKARTSSHSHHNWMRPNGDRLCAGRRPRPCKAFRGKKTPRTKTARQRFFHLLNRLHLLARSTESPVLRDGFPHLEGDKAQHR